MPRLIRIVLNTVAIISITLVLGEIVLRLTFDEFDPEHKLEFVSTEQGHQLGPAGYSGRHSKNTGDFNVAVEINSDGFRDSKSLATSNPEDWFLVGDSFSFGFGVESQHRFSDILENKLGISIYNISIPNNLEGYYFLVEHARRNGAEIGRLMIGVCMENDLADYSRTARLESAPLVTENKHDRNMGGTKYFLSTHSAIYMALTKLVHHTPVLRKLAIDSGLVIENLAGIPVTGYSKALIASSVGRLQGIADMEDIAEVLVLLIPSRGLWVENLRDKHEKIHDAFVEALERKNLKVIDLKNEFEKSGNPLSFHFTNDGHWNESGHTLAASVIAQYLENN